MIDNKIFAATLAILLCTTFSILTICKKKEHFTSPGYMLIQPPNWWFPTPYRTEQWLTPVQPEQISNPVCMTHTRGDPRLLNMNSYAYRMWRF